MPKLTPRIFKEYSVGQTRYPTRGLWASQHPTKGVRTNTATPCSRLATAVLFMTRIQARPGKELGSPGQIAVRDMRVQTSEVRPGRPVVLFPDSVICGAPPRFLQLHHDLPTSNFRIKSYASHQSFLFSSFTSLVGRMTSARAPIHHSYPRIARLLSDHDRHIEKNLPRRKIEMR